MWTLVVLCAMALIQLYWMPVTWRIALYVCISLCASLVLVWAFQRSAAEVGIDAEGAYLYKRGRFFRLVFVRANRVQLIARIEAEQVAWWHRVMPFYQVIYCDGLPRDSYRRLRSFAAQQILLSRAKDAKKRIRF